MIEMVVYQSKLIKVEPVYGEAKDQIIEMWATFRIDKYEIETFLDNYYIVPRKNLLEGIGKHFHINIVLMAYDLYRINIEEMMLKQISTFPLDPLYVVMGRVLEHDPTRGRTVVDCGIILECDTSGKLLEFWRNKIKVGDWVYLMGKMFGEIVHDGSGDKG